MRLRFRCMACLCALALLLCGAARSEEALRGYTKENGYIYVSLGRYPQSADGTVKPIVWRVLSTDEEKVWLLSEYVLFARAMHTSLKEYQNEFKGDFSQTELSHYLNSAFTDDAFTAEESDMLLPFEEFGKVFILSTAELNDKSIGLGVTLKDSSNSKKIHENPGVRAWGTEWATTDNGYPQETYPNPKAKIRNATDTANITVGEKRLFVYSANRGSTSPYWTRTQSGADKRHANCTKADGTIGHIEVGRDNEGVRPSVWLAAGSFEIVGGSGTLDDPFVLAPPEAAESIPEGDAAN
ncbi:MAG: hypothetical protein IK127_07445 [Clostridia bacterium]|nr:hypothetical protein [Clostridia bacterium]